MKTIFITGATKNTGLAIAEKFAENGYNVAISSRDGASLSKALAYLRKKYPVDFRGYTLDLSDVSDIKRVFAEIKKDFGALDVFVPNAAHLGVDMDILNVTEEEYASVMDINLKGNFFACQQAALLMKENGGGSIVIISSVHSKQCIWGRSLYSASKGGLNALMRSMAIELAPHGIRANCVLAGAIKTDRWDALTDEQIARRRANWPLGLESTGEDIANGVYYLGTDLSKTVTGTEMTIDSGVLVSLLPYNGGKR